MSNTALPSVWIVTDGKPGHENQSRAVAYHLGYSAGDVMLVTNDWPSRLDEFCFRLRVSIIPTRILPSFAEQQIKGKPAPELIISTGTLCASINVALTQRFYCRNIVIMAPGIIPYNRFRVALIPSHDITFTEPENVVETPLPPAYIDSSMISNQLEQLFTVYPELKVTQPTIAVLLGGTSKHAVFTDSYIQAIAHKLLSIMESQPALRLLITSSRRTGSNMEKLVKEILAPVQSRVFGVWASETKFNPIAGFCHIANQVIITSDSHSMISEVVTSGHHPILLELPGKSTSKHSRLLAGFIQHNLGTVVNTKSLSAETVLKNTGKGSLNPPPIWIEKVKLLTRI